LKLGFKGVLLAQDSETFEKVRIRCGTAPSEKATSVDGKQKKVTFVDGGKTPNWNPLAYCTFKSTDNFRGEKKIHTYLWKLNVKLMDEGVYTTSSFVEGAYYAVIPFDPKRFEDKEYQKLTKRCVEVARCSEHYDENFAIGFLVPKMEKEVLEELGSDLKRRYKHYNIRMISGADMHKTIEYAAKEMSKACAEKLYGVTTRE